MTSDHLPEHACARARRAVHRRLDGEPRDASLDDWLERHEKGCAPCRAFRADLEAIQATLRSWPELELPRSAIDVRPRRVAHAAWRPFAAGVLLAVAAFGAYEWRRLAARPAASEPPSTLDMIVIDPERVERDPDYARLVAERALHVLAHASRALERGERLAVRDVLGDVGGALGRVQLDETEAGQPPARENEL
jgi:hypothetical protein